MADPSARPEDTVLQRARRLWSRVYPGRQISFETYSPIVRSEYSGDGAFYTADRMSDGERVALYLAARVLNAKAGILIIDEPELYFHSRLAIHFWDELEQARSDVRFVYITHDLPFALSRQQAQFLLVKPNTEPLSLSVDQNLPESLAVAILGAASFSIYAKRIVFCEGTEGEKGDYTLYHAWFTDRTTAVLPVGNCQDVLRCVESFGTSKLVSGVSAIGIIDRDYWPDQFLLSLAPAVHALRVHEVESLYCLRGVFLAVAKQCGIPEVDTDGKYEEFRHRIVKNAPDSLITKQIAERCKLRLEPLVLGRIAELKSTHELATFEEQAAVHLNPASWIINGDFILAEEKQRILCALRGSDE